jgi:hypothetical protein
MTASKTSSSRAGTRTRPSKANPLPHQLSARCVTIRTPSVVVGDNKYGRDGQQMLAPRRPHRMPADNRADPRAGVSAADAMRQFLRLVLGWQRAVAAGLDHIPERGYSLVELFLVVAPCHPVDAGRRGSLQLPEAFRQQFGRIANPSPRDPLRRRTRTGSPSDPATTMH